MKTLGRWLVLGAAVTMIGTPAIGADDGPITVFVAKKVVTMDPGWPEATCVAVRGGKILSVGRTMEDLKPWLDRYPHAVDRTFEGKILMPGFIEPHGHPMLGGILLTSPLLTHTDSPNPYGPPFKGIKTRREAIEALKKQESAMADPEERLVAWGFDVVAYGGHLTRGELDKVSATRPIVVWDASEHFAYGNTALIKERGYTASLAKTVHGVQLGDDGELNGQFLGKRATAFVLSDYVASRMKTPLVEKALDFLVDLSVQGGITTQSEMVLGAVDLDAEAAIYGRYFNDPATPMRCVAVTDIDGLVAKAGDRAVERVREMQKTSTDKLIFRGVKSFSDDSFLGFGMVVDQPGYVDGRSGLFNNQGPRFIDQLRPFWDAGLQIHVHTNGNAGHDNVIEALAALQEMHPRFDHRFTFEHYGISTPSQARKLKALGALASVNPYYVYLRGEIDPPYLGTERAHLASRLRTLRDAGVPTAMHSDTPIGSPRPLEWAWIAVNRFGQSGAVLAPEERVGVDDALKMITIDAAYVLGLDDRIGSIEPGKFADFTVLEQDPRATPGERLRDIPVWGTVVGGRAFPASEIRPKARK